MVPLGGSEATGVFSALDLTAAVGTIAAGTVEVEVEGAETVAVAVGGTAAAGTGTSPLIAAPVSALATVPGGNTLLTLVNSSIHRCTAALTPSNTLSRSSIASRVTRSSLLNCSSVNVVGSVFRFGRRARVDEDGVEREEVPDG